jgi:hypothetical protein
MFGTLVIAGARSDDRGAVVAIVRTVCEARSMVNAIANSCDSERNLLGDFAQGRMDAFH